MGRLLITTVVALMLSNVTFAQSQDQTTTILIDWAHAGTSCGAYVEGPQDITFTDKAGPDWNDLKIHMPMETTPRPPGTDPVPTISIAINGVPIGNSVTLINRGFCFNNLQDFDFQTSALPGYRAYGTNTFSVSVTGWAAGGPPATLTFTTQAATFAFEYPKGQAGQRMLIHKYRSDDTYPSPYQIATTVSERPRHRFPGAVKAGGVGVARNVWFRVIDPPDSAEYVSAADNDNKDSLQKGALMTSNCSDATCRAATGSPLMVRSASNGVVEVVLEGTDRFAGDNYQLEASLDANFTCATGGANGENICPRSALVTAWKRIYIEKKNMFRRGAYIVRDANPGDARIAVSDPKPFSQGQVIRLIHAPRLQNFGTILSNPPIPVEFASEDNVVDRVEPSAVATQPSYLVLHHALGTSFRRDTSFNASTTLDPALYLQDAVGIVSGSTFNDQFIANPAYLTQVFDAAYVEYANAPQRITALPHEDGPMAFGPLMRLPQKWYENSIRTASPSGVRVDNLLNHRLLLGGSRTSDGTGARLGVTLSGSPNPSWVYVDRIEDAIHESNQPIFGLDPDRVNGEVSAHEAVHQWNVNDPTPLGATEHHCLEVDHRGTAFCLMHIPFYDPNHNAEFGDGTVRLHYKERPDHTVDSEYVTIRTKIEPLPVH
jgi:hypothetical protein